jgi:ribosomal protein L7/L12
MELLWIIGIVVGLIVVVVILAAAVRGMRPKMPEPQTYTPTPAHAGYASRSATHLSPPGLTPQVIAQIDRLLADGKKLAAIKVLREHTRVDLKSAKDRIDHWSISTTAPHTAAVSHATAAHTSIPAAYSGGSLRSSLPANVAADIDRLVAGGEKIIAIKVLRMHTDLGLKQAKDVIDSWAPGTRH